MKTVKFKDLPEKVQEFLLSNRLRDNDWCSSDLVNLHRLHTLREWSKATDEERLAYAEWKFPKGTKYHYSTHPHLEPRQVIGTLQIGTHESIVDSVNSNFLFHRGKWAEIIEEKEETVYDEALIRSYEWKCDSPITESVEFKAGDEVEVHLDNIAWDNDQWMKTRFYGWCNGKPICYLCGISLDENTLYAYDKIRKPVQDPDKVYREMADDILSRKSYEFATIKEFSLKRNELLNLLIEAIKKGKEL